MTIFQASHAAWSLGDVHHPLICTPTTTLTPDALLDRVRRAAGALRDAGLRCGHRVALQCPREPAFLELHLAALALGISTLPLNPRYTDEETRYLLADAAPQLVVTAAIRHHLVADGTPRWDLAGLRARLDASSPHPLPGIDAGQAPEPSTEALLGYTSGTTGRPKGAPLTHGQVDACIRTLHEAWQVSKDDVLVHALPLFHIHGLVVAQHVALRAGARTIWLDAFDAHAVVACIASERATLFMGVPTFYQRLIKLPDPPKLPSMRLWTSGSAPLPPSCHAAFETRFGARILERYGMTEIGIVLSNPYDGSRVPGSVGFPLPGTRARIVHRETGIGLPPGEVGELCIAGPSVFDGYLHRPDATAKALVDGWMHTGDLGHADADGRIFLQGRRSDLILVGGFNVYPMEVETALLNLPGIAEAAVVGIADDDLGERVVCQLVPDGPPLDDAEILDRLRAVLAAYKVPRAIGFAKSLPRNAMGKVDKRAVRRAWSEPTVRPGQHADAARIAAATVRMALATEGVTLDIDTVARGIAGSVSRPDTAVFVVELGGCPVGHVLTTTEWSDWRAVEVWWLQSLWIEPEWRRRGLGRALIDAVRIAGQAAGVPELRLYVAPSNHAARAVYTTLGFVDHGYQQFAIATER